MSCICTHCEVLDVMSLIGSEKESVSSRLKEQMKRYYCHNPETGRLLCHLRGDCRECEKATPSK